MIDTNCYAAVNTQPFEFANDDRRDTALREVSELITYKALGEQTLSGLSINRGATGPLIVRFGAWGDNVLTPETQATALQYAAANPESPIGFVDLPAHGQSSPLAKDQVHEMFQHRSISLVGKSLVQAVAQRFPDSKEVVFAGDSTGGLAALEAGYHAPDVALDPKLVTAFEPVGMDKRWSLHLAEQYLWSEWKLQQSLYKQGDDNTRLEAAFQSAKQLLATSPNPPEDFGFMKRYKGMYTKNPSLAALLFARSPLAGKSAYEAMTKSLDRSQQLGIFVVSGALSRVNRLSVVEPKMADLHRTYNARLQHVILPEQSHGLGLAPQQPIAAGFIRDRIAELKLPNR